MSPPTHKTFDGPLITFRSARKEKRDGDVVVSLALTRSPYPIGEKASQAAGGREQQRQNNGAMRASVGAGKRGQGVGR